ncbi:hypothetical protein JGX56_004247 [Salmonella enterica]|nr:hypothetical protein [Salmonella enterica]
MKNVKILAVAAALSAVMTGSAFAAAQSGQKLTITTAFNTQSVSNAVVQSKNVAITPGVKVPSGTPLATITNLPAGAKLVDSDSSTVGQIKFTQVGGTATFQAEAKDGSSNVLSDITAGSTASNYNGVGAVTVSTVADIASPSAGVYTSQPTVYTYAN